jgi:hypothetical protein
MSAKAALYIAVRETGISKSELARRLGMVHEDFNQIAVQRVVGVTFGSILRNVLRQAIEFVNVQSRELGQVLSAIGRPLSCSCRAYLCLCLCCFLHMEAPSSILAFELVAIFGRLAEAVKVSFV